MIEDMTRAQFRARRRSATISAHVKKLRGVPRPLARHGDGRGSAPFPAAPDARAACSRRRINAHGHRRCASSSRSTLDRPELARHLALVHEPQQAAAGAEPRGGAAAAGGGARRPSTRRRSASPTAPACASAEVVALKVSDIDSKRMLIRVEQGKGRKDRYAHAVAAAAGAAARLVAASRGRRAGCSRAAIRSLPITTRQLNRVCHMAAASGRDREAGDAAHAAAQLRHPSAGAEHRHPRDPGAARPRQARHDGALHAASPPT